jgi:hypothetical protein
MNKELPSKDINGKERAFTIHDGEKVIISEIAMALNIPVTEVSVYSQAALLKIIRELQTNAYSLGISDAQKENQGELEPVADKNDLD